jgi:hypothetical protein
MGITARKKWHVINYKSKQYYLNYLKNATLNSGLNAVLVFLFY